MRSRTSWSSSCWVPSARVSGMQSSMSWWILAKVRTVSCRPTLSRRACKLISCDSVMVS